MAFSILVLASCSNSNRQAEDLTDPQEENISPNQTQSVEDQARKDSASTDIIGRDTASGNSVK